MMTQDEMHAVFRELCGQPAEHEVSFRTIDTHLKNGVNIIAEALRVPKRTDTTQFALEADVYTYVLPSSVLQVQEAMWNNTHLRFSSIEEWRLYRVNWRGATSGNPQEIAADGRELFLYPPPSTAAIAIDDTLTVRWLQATFEITPAGVPGFSDSDVLLAVYAGAQEFMAFKNRDGRFNTMLQSISGLLQERIPLAQSRYSQMLQDYQPGTVAMPRMPPAR